MICFIHLTWFGQVIVISESVRTVLPHATVFVSTLIMERAFLKLLHQEQFEPEKNSKHAVDDISEVGGGILGATRLMRQLQCDR